MYILIPTDFSPTSYSAGYFAAAMIRGQYDATLVLYHVYENDDQQLQAESELRLMKDKLIDEHIVKVECIAEKGDNIIDNLERKVRHLDASLVVMGITEKSKMEQVLTGSNSLRMIEKNVCPVLVVPEDARFQEIKNVAVACDFKDVESSIPLVPVKKVLNLFRPNLHIVNINSEIYVSLSEEYLVQRSKLHQMFEEFSPEFYFITTYDFHETLRQFINDKKIDLVLTFPRKHSFIDNFLKGNNTKKLVYESAIPVLAAHE